ncbi:MAG: hypothetical protein ACXABY_06965 [Candidatus Thorarchaeota archaeon]
MPFTYSYKQTVVTLSAKLVTVGGAPDTGRSATITVEDAEDGTKYLDEQALTEIGTSGIYTYNWTHGLSTSTHLYVTVEATGGGPPEFFFDTVELHIEPEDVLDDIDEREATVN